MSHVAFFSLLHMDCDIVIGQCHQCHPILCHTSATHSSCQLIIMLFSFIVTWPKFKQRETTKWRRETPLKLLERIYNIFDEGSWHIITAIYFYGLVNLCFKGTR